MARSGSPARASASASAIFNSPSKMQDVLFAQELDAAAHVLEPAAERAARSRRQTLEKHAERSKQGQVVLTREAGEFGTLVRAPAHGRRASIRTRPRAMPPSASVPACVKGPRSASCIRSTREIARSTSPSGHEAIAR